MILIIELRIIYSQEYLKNHVIKTGTEKKKEKLSPLSFQSLETSIRFQLHAKLTQRSNKQLIQLAYNISKELKNEKEL